MAYQRTTTISLNVSGMDAGTPVVAHLILTTDRASKGGIESLAIVEWRGGVCAVRAFGRGDSGDFYRTVHQTDRMVRATQKRIDTQHAEVFTPEVVKELQEAAKAQSLTSSFFRPSSNVA